MFDSASVNLVFISDMAEVFAVIFVDKFDSTNAKSAGVGGSNETYLLLKYPGMV
jgi:hypothetical protein